MTPHDDEPEAMMRDSLLICAMFWAGILALAFLPACTQHKVDVSSSSVDKVVDRIAALDKPVKCRTLDLPPVPQDVVLDIKGDNITANAGGELMLRSYVACRSLGAPVTTKP